MNMHANPQLAHYFEELLVENDHGPWQRLQFMLREELRLIMSVALKIGAALLILEALVWIAAESDHGAPEAMTASAGPSQAAKTVNTTNAAVPRQFDRLHEAATQ